MTGLLDRASLGIGGWRRFGRRLDSVCIVLSLMMIAGCGYEGYGKCGSIGDAELDCEASAPDDPDLPGGPDVPDEPLLPEGTLACRLYPADDSPTGICVPRSATASPSCTSRARAAHRSR